MDQSKLSDHFVSVEQAAKEVKISIQGIYKALDQKRLKGERIGDHWIINKIELQKFKENRI